MSYLGATIAVLCECDPSTQQEDFLGLVRSQLDRCGPQNLHEPRPLQDETPATLWPFVLVAALLLTGGLIYFCRSEVRHKLAVRNRVAASLEDEPRWHPPRGSSARLL